MEGLISDRNNLMDCLRNAALAVQLCVANYDFHTKKGPMNQSGDAQLDLDIAADRAVAHALRQCPIVAGFCSEEREGFVPTNSNGRYIVVYDPLDGSQNVSVGITVGSIFGVLKGRELQDLSSGRDMVCAAYGVHGASLLFCGAHLSDTTGPVLERFDQTGRNWVPVRRDIQIPAKGKTYCINEGNTRNWSSWTTGFVTRLKAEKRSIRWGACMVMDVHRPLLQGGIFAYPEDAKYPNGRLRLVYEAYPMAFLWEKAGGVALSSINMTTQSAETILDRRFPHNKIHSRSGVVLVGPHEADCLFEQADANSTWTTPPSLRPQPVSSKL